MHGTAYSFRSVSHSDLPLLNNWLKTPEVRRWWGNPEEEIALIEGDINDPRVDMHIISFRARPFAYAQDYDVHGWPQPHLSELAYGTRAIDTLIGVPEMLAQGHGSNYLRLLATRLLEEGAPGVVIDPDADNQAAIRAYTKAGFSGDTVVDTEDGPAILMYFDATHQPTV